MEDEIVIEFEDRVLRLLFVVIECCDVVEFELEV